MEYWRSIIFDNAYICRACKASRELSGTDVRYVVCDPLRLKIPYEASFGLNSQEFLSKLIANFVNKNERPCCYRSSRTKGQNWKSPGDERNCFYGHRGRVSKDNDKKPFAFPCCYLMFKYWVYCFIRIIAIERHRIEEHQPIRYSF